MPDAVRVVPCGGLQLELLLGSRARVRHPDGPVLTVAYSHKGGPKSPSNTKRVTGRNVIVKATVTGQRVTGRVVAAFGLGTIEEVLSNLTILPDERPTARDVPQGRLLPRRVLLRRGSAVRLAGGQRLQPTVPGDWASVSGLRGGRPPLAEGGPSPGAAGSVAPDHLTSTVGPLLAS